VYRPCLVRQTLAQTHTSIGFLVGRPERTVTVCPFGLLYVITLDNKEKIKRKWKDRRMENGNRMRSSGKPAVLCDVSQFLTGYGYTKRDTYFQTKEDVQQYKQPTRCNNLGLLILPKQFYMFRALITPILRSTLTIFTAFGMIHRLCCRPVTRLTVSPVGSN
jgi:hypothetical protein